VAQYGNLVYVLNAGLRLDHGKLTEIPESARFLTTNLSGAASVSFSQNGKFLVVTERLPNTLDVFDVQGDDTLSPIVVTSSAGPGAFSEAVSLPTEQRWFPKPDLLVESTQRLSLPTRFLPTEHLLPSAPAFQRWERQLVGRRSPRTAVSSTRRTPPRLPSPDL
jgi:hypothetical protein